MRALRGPIIAALVVSGPIMLMSYGWMIKHFVTTAPVWLSVVVVIAHFLVWLGIGSLFDRQQERRQS